MGVAADAATASRRLLIVSDRHAWSNTDSFSTQRMRRVRRPSFEPPPRRDLRETLALPEP